MICLPMRCSQGHYPPSFPPHPIQQLVISNYVNLINMRKRKCEWISESLPMPFVDKVSYQGKRIERYYTFKFIWINIYLIYVNVYLNTEQVQIIDQEMNKA